ncbi:undecaprenyl-diphosphate phosphatase [uncultured Brachyspira sp.]|uniref:undecaprenyl-diphosphate phosphatase n=1 Tax=uncultured Brachyspira sp. TaxID=221953 RepID=UPI0025DDE639|nr:undecaprenyl-diphosphate phosphatase [uncultured Brachyspira sp.]
MIKAVILGLIQAITEFLPVSSSGHLRIIEYFIDFHLENILSFEVALHFGTFLAVCLVFHKDIINAIAGFFTGLKDINNASKNNEGFRMSLMVIVASIPIAVTGLLLEKYLSNIDLSRIGLNLIITGSVLLLTRKLDKNTYSDDLKDLYSMTYRNAFTIGLAQSIAVFPGISRSGLTISIALFLGLNRDLAGKFSFLISLPAVFGALLLSIKDIADFNITYSLAGFVSAFIFGIIALKLLLSFLKKGRLFYFGFYCMIAGMAVFFYFMQL